MQIKRIIFLFYLFIFIYSTIQPAHASPLTSYAFPNGLTFIFKQQPSSEVVVMDLFIKTGTLFEKNEEAGITNLVQSLTLKGTRKHSAEQIAYAIDSLGSILSTNTAEDYAEVYTVTTRKYFSAVYDLFFEVVTQPSFPAEEVKKERKNILNAIKAKKDSIFTVTYDLLNENIFTGHPYHKPVSGYSETVEKFTYQDLVSWFDRFYRPQNMILVIVGNLDEKRLLKEIRKTFGNLPSPFPLPSGERTKVRGTIPSPPRGEEEKVRGPKYQIVTSTQPFQQAYLMFGWLSPPINSPDYAVLKVINSILGEGMSSRLFLNLRDKQSLAYEVSSFYPSRKEQSKFVIYLGLDGSNLKKAHHATLTEIEKIKTEPVSSEELEEKINHLIGDFLMQHQTVKQQAWWLGWYEILGKGFSYDEIYPDQIKKVTPEQIKEVACKYFTKNYVFIQLVPE